MRLTQAKKAEILAILKGILDSVPDDRSCHTCIHLAGKDADAWCLHWKAAIPNDAMSAGCAEWREEEVLF